MKIIKQTLNGTYGSELLEMISNNRTYSNTVANETVQALRTTCKSKATETAGKRLSKVKAWFHVKIKLF